VFEFFTGQQGEPSEVHVHVSRLLLSNIPKDLNEIRLWLHNRFVEKDALIDEFYRTGKFVEPVETPTPSGSTLVNLSSFLFLNSAVWSALFFPQVRRVYLYTISISPLLLCWIKIRGLI
jgi:hypothetical protein